MKKILGNLLLLIFSAGLTFGLFEICLRLGVVDNPQHGKLTYRGDVSADDKKLLILGDSFIEWDGELSHMLSDAFAERGVKVLNTAVGGTSPVEYHRAMMEFAPSFKPDIVLLSYYVGNDLTGVKNNKALRSDLKSKLHTALLPWLDNFYTYQFLQKVMAIMKLRKLDKQLESLTGGNQKIIDLARRAEINPWLILTAIGNKNYILDNLLMESESDRVAWNHSRKLFSEIQKKSNELGAKLMMVVFPATVQMDKSHFEIYRELGLNLDDRTLKETKPQDLFMEFCQEKNISCLNMFHPIKKQKGEQLYLENDTHLNTQGNQLSTEEIVSFVMDEFSKGVQ